MAKLNPENSEQPLAGSLEKPRSEEVRRRFAAIARRYDRANRWMTWGQDDMWRAEVITRAQLPRAGRLLDVGAGTGDLAMKAACRDARLFVVAADFTLEMMQAGRLKRAARSVCWVNNDALNLPYPSETFDAVISGYLLRNVNDIRIALVEQLRVLRSGGRIVCLDTTPPPPDIWHLPVRLYLKYMIPLIGGLAAGDMPAYHYLSESTVQFVSAGGLGELMRQVGFKEVGYRCFMGGCMAIHWGRK